MKLPEGDAKTFPELPGYILTEQLYTGSRTVVYRAQSISQQQPVVIKILRRAYPSFNEIIQFRNQYALVRDLDCEGIARPLSLEPWQNSYFLVMEDNGSISLAQYAREHPLDLTAVLIVATQIAEILHHLHDYRIIHKDIKPANILIHPDTQQVKLIDFSIASLLPKESQEIQNPNVLEGTLAYIAPEQTGRMNRAIDYRTDFYSFGVTLYELLTRQLPFSSDEPLELIHCHIAQGPIPPHQIDPQIPPLLSALVMKLMAKNAEDRYQSALGLKYDLEQCARHWQESRRIEEFELGQRDLYDPLCGSLRARFTIPEKLYGREEEVAQLLAAFDRVSGNSKLETSLNDPQTEGSSEMLLVTGLSGIGKTAVINEVHKPITRQKGYFIKGKFDQFNRSIPLSAFVQAFRGLIVQLLADSDDQNARWRSQILAAVGDNARVLIEVIPELERILGEQPSVQELSGTAAQNRFNLVLQRFIAVFTRPEHPLVIFLDDLQWADSASLQLMKLLMQDRNYLLLLGAYRDNEVSSAHPLMLALEELKQTGKIINTIALAPLTPYQTNQLVADTLHCPPRNALSLSELLDRKTQGNPFFITQFLKALSEEDCLKFNFDRGYWEFDPLHSTSSSLSDNIVEFMAQQLQKLSDRTQENLKFAACIGNQFDLATLAIILEKKESEIAATLWEALQEGLILSQSEVYKLYASYKPDEGQPELQANASYRFLHDRVQQAAYTLIDETERNRTHCRIGQLLLDKIPQEQREERIFEIVNQLNYSKDFIEEQTERDRVARLNLIACRRARTSTAYNASRNFAQIGLALLGEKAWEREYDLTLALSDLAVELAYLCGDYEAVETLAETVVARTKTILERIEVYQIQIQARMACARLTEALDFGIDILKQLGVTFPDTPSKEDIAREVAEIARLMGGRSIEDLIDLPRATNPAKIATIQIAKNIFPAAYFSGSQYYILIVTLAIKLSIEFGNTPDSAISYVCYGRISCLELKDIESGAKFGKLAVKLVDRFDIKALKPEISTVVGLVLWHRKFHLRETLPLLREGYQIALEVGNPEYAFYNALAYFPNAFWANIPLTKLEQEARTYQTGPMHAKTLFLLQWQLIENLLGFSDNPIILLGDYFNESEFMDQNAQSPQYPELFHLYLFKLMLGYLFGNLEGAKALDRYRNNLAVAIGSVEEPVFYLYESLAILAEFPPSEKSPSQAWQQVEENQAQLQDWAHHAPMNYQHKVDLIEAEKCRILDRKLDAIELYDKAIAGAKENEYVQEEALANELAAKFFLGWGKQQVAAGYMQQAYYAYTRWGSKAKTDDLERRYPDLLHPILHSVAPKLNFLDTLTTLASSNTAPLSSTSLTGSSSSSFNNSLDFAVILKVAQSISSRIQFDELIAQLTGAILQYSGADRCALILPNRVGQWCIEAISTLESTQLHSQQLDESTEVPVKLIQYVKNTGTAIAIDNLNTPLPILDVYLSQSRPQSILVQPILDRGNLVGLLYLENRLTRGVFTQERLLVLNFLCAQAAISLENARLYREARDYAQQLEQSQLQIVQSEKMASLGNLVAGVAHEINNPIGFLNGSVSNAKDFLNDLLEHIALYEECVPDPPEEVTEHAEDIDLEFTSEDFPKLLGSMQGALDRITSISNSLRTFSRADTEKTVLANLHEGLDSTLLILKYRLKANENRPAIAVVKDYGDIPEIECFPGQLNQVFMNLIANAIDALDEFAQQHSYQELEAQKQQIFLQTALNESGNAVEIRLRDNGGGISEELLPKIFQHLFTTKGVGKGTGLGLAIARQIIVEKHRGKIEVRSFASGASPSAIDRGTEFCIRLPLSP